MKNCVALTSASPVASRRVETHPWIRLAPRQGDQEIKITNPEHQNGLSQRVA
jgi:hypothetical protein